MRKGLVSVIMPTFNESRFLAESIECVLGQSYADLELLITDDNSTNAEVHEILHRYAARDSRVKVFFLKENKGPGYARNHSITEAEGQYIAFCDSDDRWTPDKLEKQVAFMQEHKMALSYTSYYLCDQDGEVYGVVNSPARMTYARLKRDNKIGCLTAMYDTAICGKVLMPTIRKRQDWGLFLLLLRDFGAAYGIAEPLAYYRKHRNSVSKKKRPLIKYNAKVYQEVLGHSAVYAYLYLIFIFLPTYLLKRIGLWARNLFFRN